MGVSSIGSVALVAYFMGSFLAAGKHWHMDLGQLDVSSSQGDSSVLSCLLVVAILTILLFLLVFLVC